MNSKPEYVWHATKPQVIKYFLPTWTNHNSPQSTWIAIDYQYWKGTAYVPALKMTFKATTTLALYEATSYLKKLMGIADDVGSITTGFQGQDKPTSDDLLGKFGFSADPYYNPTFFETR